MRDVFRKLRTALDVLDDSRTTIVTYDKLSCQVTMRQVQNKKVVLTNLTGYLIPHKGTSILTADDLVSLKDTLSIIADSKTPVLVTPVVNGYDVYVQGDVYYTSKPRIGYKIRLSSITNKLLLRFMRWTSEEIAMLYRLNNVR